MAMAEGALKRSPADLAVAVTGVAGPEPDAPGVEEVAVACLTELAIQLSMIRRDKLFGNENR